MPVVWPRAAAVTGCRDWQSNACQQQGGHGLPSLPHPLLPSGTEELPSHAPMPYAMQPGTSLAAGSLNCQFDFGDQGVVLRSSREIWGFDHRVNNVRPYTCMSVSGDRRTTCWLRSGGCASQPAPPQLACSAVRTRGQPSLPLLQTAWLLQHSPRQAAEPGNTACTSPGRALPIT